MTTELENAMASLRSALPDDETDHGHMVIESDAIRSVLAALSTPPADDVREALIGCIARDEQDWRFGDFEETSNHSPSLAEYIADGILANPLFEVRPHGTVTDAEVEAGAQALFEDPAYDPEYTWAQMVVEDPSRADIWRAEARRILEAAREVRPYGTVTDAAALAKAWDEGFTLATRNSPNQPHPLAQSNPYRGEARS